MYQWQPDMIRFMEDASAYNHYHEEIAEQILPGFKATDHICDAGCGLGTLSLILSRNVAEVTAVDIAHGPLEVLRRSCAEQNVSNIRIREGDISLLPPEHPYDGMVFCFFGRTEEILRIARAQCRGKVFIIKRNYARHRFSVGEHDAGKDDALYTQKLLEQAGIPYKTGEITPEFGQPFRSFEDIRRFYEIYSRDEDPSLLTDEFLRSRVIPADDPVFPWYMPHKRKLAIIEFEVNA